MRDVDVERVHRRAPVVDVAQRPDRGRDGQGGLQGALPVDARRGQPRLVVRGPHRSGVPVAGAVPDRDPPAHPAGSSRLQLQRCGPGEQPPGHLFADRRHGPLQSVQPVRQVVEEVGGGQELQVGAGPADRPAGGLVQCGPPGRRVEPGQRLLPGAEGVEDRPREEPVHQQELQHPGEPRRPAGRCAGRHRGRSTPAGWRSSPRSPRRRRSGPRAGARSCPPAPGCGRGRARRDSRPGSCSPRRSRRRWRRARGRRRRTAPGRSRGRPPPGSGGRCGSSSGTPRSPPRAPPARRGRSAGRRPARRRSSWAWPRRSRAAPARPGCPGAAARSSSGTPITVNRTAQAPASSTLGSSSTSWKCTSSSRAVSSARSTYRPIQNSASATRLSIPAPSLLRLVVARAAVGDGAPHRLRGKRRRPVGFRRPLRRAR